MLLKSSACRRIFCQISSPIRNVSSSFFVFTSQKFLIGHQGFLFTCEHSMFVGVSTVSSSSSLFSLSIVKLINGILSFVKKWYFFFFFFFFFFSSTQSFFTHWRIFSSNKNITGNIRIEFHSDETYLTVQFELFANDCNCNFIC